jgi:DNA repair exonuclease SbcCD ATPase subunit
MQDRQDPRQVHAQFVDAIFARAPIARGPVDPTRTPMPPVALDGSRYERQDLAAPPAPPPSGDAESDYQWLLEERKRLEAYTHKQLALVKQQREEFLRTSARMEESLAHKGQELNRQLKQAQAQAEALEKRERDIAEREALLANHEEQITAARQLRQENDALQQALSGKRVEATELREAVRLARHELVAYEEALQYRKRAWQQQQDDLAARQARLDDRYRALEQAEESLQQRLQEVDDLEVKLRTELEERERQLALEQQQTEALREQLRLKLSEPELDPRLPS